MHFVWKSFKHLHLLKGQCHEIFCFWFFSWISFPPAPEYPIRTVSNFFENSRRYSQVKVHHRCQRHRRQNLRPVSLVLLIPVANLPPVSTTLAVSTTPVANLPPVSTTPAAKLLPVSTIPTANLPPVSATPAANFSTNSASVVDTGGKFATGVNDTGGNLPPVSTTPAANLPPVSMTPVANNGNNIRLLRP